MVLLSRGGENHLPCGFADFLERPVFLIRQAKQEDVAALAKLARLVYFINLPPDERIVAEKVARSQVCFRRLGADIAGVTRPSAAPGAKKRRSSGPSGFTHI